MKITPHSNHRFVDIAVSENKNTQAGGTKDDIKSDAIARVCIVERHVSEIMQCKRSFDPLLNNAVGASGGRKDTGSARH